MQNKFPKIIWFLWFQGLEQAPLVVQKCYKSWQGRNPNWEVRFLSNENLREYVNLALPQGKEGTLTVALYSDFIRLNILSKYGGVWVDATCFCMDSLDNWLNGCIGSGFFAFCNPDQDRLIASWFLAAEKGNYIVVKLYNDLCSYWGNNDLCNHDKKFLLEKIDTLLNRNTSTTKYWFSFVVTKIFKVFPYCAFHYKFTELLRHDPMFLAIWNNTKKISADIPHAIQHAGMFGELTEGIKKEIDNKKSPLYKLTWKYSPADLKQGCPLHYLLETLSIK